MWEFFLDRNSLIQTDLSLRNVKLNNLAWCYEDAIKMIDICLERNSIILGGDVLASEENEIYYTYDSWSYDIGSNINNQIQSCYKAKKYIAEYNRKNKGMYYYVLIIG